MSKNPSVNSSHNIAIVGDSYCAAFRYRIHPPEGRPHQKYQNSGDTWVDSVLDRYNNRVDIHGYAGRSWWYSWHNFYKFWHPRFEDLETVIFCHTGYSRINNAWNEALCLMPQYHPVRLTDVLDQTGTPWPSESKLKKAHALYYRYIHDPEFYIFAQLSYAHAISRLLGHIKTVHFLCFDQPPDFVAALPGTVFTTPLIDVSTSTGLTLDDVNKLPNHFTPEINRAFGQLVIDAVDNYRPGARPIDLTQFGLQ